MTCLEGLWMLPLLAVALPDVGVHRAALDGAHRRVVALVALLSH